MKSLFNGTQLKTIFARVTAIRTTMMNSKRSGNRTSNDSDEYSSTFVNRTDSGRRTRRSTNWYHASLLFSKPSIKNNREREKSNATKTYRKKGKAKAMADGLANEWGANLVFLDAKNRRKYMDRAVTLLEAAIRRTTDEKFALRKIASCGSDANLHAVAEASFGQTDAVLIGCGMYVAGDKGPLHQWSTSSFDITSGPSFIVTPAQTLVTFTKEHVVALPYIIPLQEHKDQEILKEIHAYEDECLHELHIRLLLNKLNGRPTKVLFLEIMLSGNGAELSDRVLERLGQLSRHHNFSIVVDEILTGGRCGTMLLTQQAPGSFQERVTHITMGKWLQAGLVLSSEAFKVSSDETLIHYPSRGPSTEINATPPYLCWELVDEMLEYTDQRREEVISHLNGISENDCWGRGVIIFAPAKRTDAEQGLKNRFLPMLEKARMDKFRWERNPDWSKTNVSAKIVEGVKLWITHMKDAWAADVRKTFCEYLATEFIGKHPFTITKDMKEQISRLWQEPLELYQLKDILKDAAKSELVASKVKTAKRIRGWEIGRINVTPWRLHQEEERKGKKSKAYKVYRPIAGQRQRDEAGIEEDCEYEYEVDNRKEQ